MSASSPGGLQGPLHGLRVVELSSFVASPLCGLTLAQLGADVVRVEPMGGAADRGRWPLSPSGTSLYWSGLNRGKRAVEVDLGSEEGRRLVADLVVDGGGVLVTNTERWADLGFDALRQRRPDVVHVTLVGRRDGGTAVDYTVQAASGFPMVTGPKGHEAPVNHVMPAWDITAGLYLATGLLAAERHRARTGVGQQVRVALEDVALSVAGTLGYLTDAQLGSRREREGNDVYGTFGTDFTTADGVRLMLVVLTQRQWTDLLSVTGLGRVVDELEQTLGADFTDEGERYRHRSALFGLLDSWFGRHHWDEVASALRRTRVLWSRYRTFADLAADDAAVLREHPLFDEVDQPGVGRYLAPGSPVLVGSDAVDPAVSPDVGEHTESVLAEALGLTPEELRDLSARGVVRSAEHRRQSA